VREDQPEIPVVALREALANAVAHREYHQAAGSISVWIFDDRVEITSTGPLHFGLSVAALYRPHEPLPWNPIIAQLLYRRGIVDSLGSGTLRMVRLCREAGLLPPLIEDTGISVRVTFVRAGHLPPALRAYELDEQQRALLLLLASRAPMARTELVQASDLPERRVRTVMDSLRELGLVDYTGERRGARWSLAGPARVLAPPPSS
jgi:ATP-dependent DNA helicase RecG